MVSSLIIVLAVLPVVVRSLLQTSSSSTFRRHTIDVSVCPLRQQQQQGNTKQNIKQRRCYISSLYSSSKVDTDEFDIFMDEISVEDEQQPTTTTNSATQVDNIPSHFINRERETSVGIGGKDGFVYDVNKLKRNLVQESIRGCKQELLVLLGDGRQSESTISSSSSTSKSNEDGKQKVVVPPRWRRDRDDLIEERLAALVQANPVSTTTDSNLLDGEWSFAFATNEASTILDTSRFLLSKTKRIEDDDDNVNEKKEVTARGGPWSFRAGKTENPFRSSTRQIYLENLDIRENAHIIDETRVLGGLFQISQRYDVYGLTRTAIDLDLVESESNLFGICTNSEDKDDFKGTKKGEPLEIQIIYLDNDLCICTTGLGLSGPLHVYTKSDLWVTGGAKRKLRLIGKTLSWISQMQSPLRIRQRLVNIFTKKNTKAVLKANPDLQAINIGELETNEDQVWDGEDDPFMHLSAGERMEVMKSMTLQDIYQSASERKEQNKQQRRINKYLKGKWQGEKGKFNRPDSRE